MRAVIEKMWENENLQKPRILRFFHEFFGYHKAGTIFKGSRSAREFAEKILIKGRRRAGDALC